MRWIDSRREEESGGGLLRFIVLREAGKVPRVWWGLIHQLLTKLYTRFKQSSTLNLGLQDSVDFLAMRFCVRDYLCYI